MVDTWLYENLWIWQIFVSKEEHKNENIKLIDTIEDKDF